MSGNGKGIMSGIERIVTDGGAEGRGGTEGRGDTGENITGNEDTKWRRVSN